MGGAAAARSQQLSPLQQASSPRWGSLPRAPRVATQQQQQQQQPELSPPRQRDPQPQRASAPAAAAAAAAAGDGDGDGGGALFDALSSRVGAAGAAALEAQLRTVLAARGAAGPEDLRLFATGLERALQALVRPGEGAAATRRAVVAALNATLAAFERTQARLRREEVREGGGAPFEAAGHRDAADAQPGLPDAARPGGVSQRRQHAESPCGYAAQEDSQQQGALPATGGERLPPGARHSVDGVARELVGADGGGAAPEGRRAVAALLNALAARTGGPGGASRGTGAPAALGAADVAAGLPSAAAGDTVADGACPLPTAADENAGASVPVAPAARGVSTGGTTAAAVQIEAADVSGTAACAPCLPSGSDAHASGAAAAAAAAAAPKAAAAMATTPPPSSAAPEAPDEVTVTTRLVREAAGHNAASDGGDEELCCLTGRVPSAIALLLPRALKVAALEAVPRDDAMLADGGGLQVRGSWGRGRMGPGLFGRWWCMPALHVLLPCLLGLHTQAEQSCRSGTPPIPLSCSPDARAAAAGGLQPGAAQAAARAQPRRRRARRARRRL